MLRRLTFLSTLGPETAEENAQALYAPLKLLDGSGRMPPAPEKVDASVMEDGDRQIMQALSSGLELVPCPFAALADMTRRWAGLARPSSPAGARPGRSAP